MTGELKQFEAYIQVEADDVAKVFKDILDLDSRIRTADVQAIYREDGEYEVQYLSNAPGISPNLDNLDDAGVQPNSEKMYTQVHSLATATEHDKPKYQRIRVKRNEFGGTFVDQWVYSIFTQER